MTVLTKLLWISLLIFQVEILEDESVANQSFDFFILKYVGWALVVLSLCFLIFVQYRLLKKTLKLEDSLKELKGTIKYLKQAINSLESNYDKINRVDEKVDHFIKNFEYKNAAVKTKQLENEEQRSQPIVLKIDNVPTYEEPERLNNFYFSTPYVDNKFLISDGKTVPNDKTVYCISNQILCLHDNISEEAMNSALNSMDLVIKTACQVINSKQSNHTMIVMIEPGKVIKEDDDYRIIEKIKVKFQ